MDGSNREENLIEGTGSNTANHFNKMNLSDLYLKLYNDTLEAGLDIDHEILQKGFDFRTATAGSADVVHGDEASESSLMLSSGYQRDDHIKRHLAETEARHKLFYKMLLEKENLLQMQEERRKEAEKEFKDFGVTTESKEQQVQQLLQEGLDVQKDTLRIREFVESSKKYKEYVERSVPLWDKEAKSVHDVCGRFRDLLTLRCELMVRVKKAFANLHKTRMIHQDLIKNENVAEGQALLEVYKHRDSLLFTNRAIENAETELRTLRDASLKIVTDLTRVRLALSNMYSVACRFQEALPPADPQTKPTEILEHLHNFIVDATQVLQITQMEHDSDSMKADKGSV